MSQSSSLRMPGFIEVRKPEARATLPNPPSAAAHGIALRTVLLHLITDTFDLRPEETLWVGWQLDKACHPLAGVMPHSVPLAVRQEMLDGTYTRLLELRERARKIRGQVWYDSAVLQASAEEWAEALMAPITQSYSLRPLVESAMYGHILGLLRELGVGDPVNPRGATHPPLDVRQRLIDERTRP